MARRRRMDGRFSFGLRVAGLVSPPIPTYVITFYHIIGNAFAADLVSACPRSPTFASLCASATIFYHAAATTIYIPPPHANSLFLPTNAPLLTCNSWFLRSPPSQHRLWHPYLPPDASARVTWHGARLPALTGVLVAFRHCGWTLC